MAKYRSKLMMNTWWIDEAAKSLMMCLVNRSSVQYSSEVSPCKFKVLQAMYMGWANNPIKTSVTAKQPTSILEDVLSLGLVFTATITNAFNKMVKGQDAMAITVSNAMAMNAVEFSGSRFPPRTCDISHSSAGFADPFCEVAVLEYITPFGLEFLSSLSSVVNYNRPRSWFEVECVVNSVLVGNITKLLSFNSVRKAYCFPVLSLKKL